MSNGQPPPPDIESTLAANIKAHIAAAGITRKSLYDRAGIARATFDRSMAGGRSFTVNEVVRIANVLGLKFSDLLHHRHGNGHRDAA